LWDMHVRLQLDGEHLSKYGEEAVCVAQLSSVPAGPSLMVDDAFLPSNVTLNPQQKAIYDVVIGFLQRSNPHDPKVVHIETCWSACCRMHDGDGPCFGVLGVGGRVGVCMCSACVLSDLLGETNMLPMPDMRDIEHRQSRQSQQ
jgi:hypothetical protein